MIDRESGEEINHLVRVMQFLKCAEAFEKARRGEPISGHQHALMVRLSAFLLYVWAYHHYHGLDRLKRFTAIPFNQAVQAWSDVNDMYGGGGW